MKSITGSRMKRRLVTAALVAIVVLVVLLRVFNMGHVLMYDEAWNVNSIIDAATGNTEDVFYNNFLRHPPLYTSLGALYAAVTGVGRSGLAIAMELISLISAVALVLAIFLCGKDWFDERVGLAAAFLFAVMPAARIYDSLIKQESMTVLFGMLFLLFFFRGRYLLSGLLLGLAMLTKEVFVFLPAALFLFLLVSRRFADIKGFLASLGVGALMSFWWYAFVSTSSGEFLRFYLGRSQESANWREPWHFYLGRLPADIGWVTLALCLIGVICLFAYVHRHGWPGASSKADPVPDEPAYPRGSQRPEWEMALFLLVWIAAMYAFLAISLGKPPWLVYSSLPAFALMGGWGLFQASRLLAARPAFARAAVVISLACALALSVPVGFQSFMNRADRTYARSVSYKAVADYLNQRMPRDGRTMLRLNDVGPNLLFYLDSYHPGSVYLLDREPDAGEEGGLSSDYTVLVVPTDANAAELAAHAATTRPEFLVMRPGFKSADGSDPALELASFSRPAEIDGVWVFDGRTLPAAAGTPSNP